MVWALCTLRSNSDIQKHLYLFKNCVLSYTLISVDLFAVMCVLKYFWGDRSNMRLLPYCHDRTTLLLSSEFGSKNLVLINSTESQKHKITESLNHRLVGIGRDYLSSGPTPAQAAPLRSGHLGSHLGCFWRSPNRRFHSLWAACASAPSNSQLWSTPWF